VTLDLRLHWRNGARVLSAIESWPAVFRDAEGRVVGFLGLTVAERPRTAGEGWVGRPPGTFLLSLPDAFELARISNRRLATALATSAQGG
jgi:hypothetical protein